MTPEQLQGVSVLAGGAVIGALFGLLERVRQARTFPEAMRRMGELTLVAAPLLAFLLS